MAKLKLKPVDKLVDPAVIGISSHVNPHRLCWSLNKTLGLELTRRSDLVNEEDGVRACYAAFEQVIEPEGFRWTLVNNHSGSGILVKQQRQTDYFLLMDPELQEDHPDTLERVRSAEFILTAYPLVLDQLRNGHLLLL
jgi:hypothetical protein